MYKQDTAQLRRSPLNIRRREEQPKEEKPLTGVDNFFGAMVPIVFFAMAGKAILETLYPEVHEEILGPIPRPANARKPTEVDLPEDVVKQLQRVGSNVVMMKKKEEPVVGGQQ